MARLEIDEYLKAGRTLERLQRVGLYAAIALSPLLIAVVTRAETDHPFVQELAKNFAMVGYSVLAVQFVLSARFHWVERPFGLDVVFQFHRRMGFFPRHCCSPTPSSMRLQESGICLPALRIHGRSRLERSLCWR